LRAQFLRDRLGRLTDEPRPGAPRSITDGAYTSLYIPDLPIAVRHRLRTLAGNSIGRNLEIRLRDDVVILDEFRNSPAADLSVLVQERDERRPG
jgi:hypothetical protein